MKNTAGLKNSSRLLIGQGEIILFFNYLDMMAVMHAWLE